MRPSHERSQCSPAAPIDWPLRASELLDDDVRLACHLADLAAWAAPDDASIHGMRADVYAHRRRTETSLMAKGIFAGAMRDSKALSDPDD